MHDFLQKNNTNVNFTQTVGIAGTIPCIHYIPLAMPQNTHTLFRFQYIQRKKKKIHAYEKNMVTFVTIFGQG